jgi:hypothetical protein
MYVPPSVLTADEPVLILKPLLKKSISSDSLSALLKSGRSLSLFGFSGSLVESNKNQFSAASVLLNNPQAGLNPV